MSYCLCGRFSLSSLLIKSIDSIFFFQRMWNYFKLSIPCIEICKRLHRTENHFSPRLIFKQLFLFIKMLYRFLYEVLLFIVERTIDAKIEKNLGISDSVEHFTTRKHFCWFFFSLLNSGYFVTGSLNEYMKFVSTTNVANNRL